MPRGLALRHSLAARDRLRTAAGALGTEYLEALGNDDDRQSPISADYLASVRAELLDAGVTPQLIDEDIDYIR